MNAIISFIIVTVGVLGGFVMAHGPLEVLWQPSEYIVIGGAAIGALIGYAPLPVFFKILKSIPRVVKGSGIDRDTYLQLMGLLMTIFNVIRKEGVLGIEKDLADPHTSERFKRYPAIANNHHAMELMVGSLRLFVDGVVNAFDLDKLMETEIETHHKEAERIPSLINKMSDALPGLGIVAAVLGIIITMQFLDGPPSVIGHHVAAALVGTMLGVLLSYGLVGPVATKMDFNVKSATNILKTVQVGLVSFAGGAPPQVALEFARKTIPSDFRPSGEELEEILKNAKKAG